MKIVSGTKNDPVIASNMCQFVMKALSKTIVDIQNLQKILIELMSNVFHHAYNRNNDMNKDWYIYAEHNDDFVRIIFVDTGAGIAQTVRKNFLERVTSCFGFNPTDEDLIMSAFNGDFRTETKEKHRGNGLIGVKEIVLNGSFRNFTVISGSAKCMIVKNNQEEIIKSNYNNRILGTVYIFDVI